MNSFFTAILELFAITISASSTFIPPVCVFRPIILFFIIIALGLSTISPFFRPAATDICFFCAVLLLVVFLAPAIRTNCYWELD